MFGRSKRRQTKAWALDDGGNPGLGLRERLGGNSRLWLACLIAIVGVAIILLARSGGNPGKPSSPPTVGHPVGIYTDRSHHKFVADLAKMARRRGVTVRGVFLSDKEFKLVLPCDVTSDELTFLSRFAATSISRRFKVSPEVLTYTEDNNSPIPRLTARTAWSPERGEFVVKFERPLGSD